MLRRLFLSSIPLLCAAPTAIGLQVADPEPTAVSPSEFDAALEAAIASSAFESSRGRRELQFRDRALTEAQTSMRHGRSERKIDPRAIALIVSAEVSSRARYEQRYKHPEWPGGRSGITIGIGYDLGFVSPDAFQDHWKDLLAPEQMHVLASVCRLKSDKAKARLASVRAIRIDWDPAEQQFHRFLPYVIAETEKVFQNTRELSDMSMGALVSLVYNRGGNTNPAIPRRRHMFAIKQAMLERRFEAIPGHIRDMKILWENEKDARGVLVRRDLEASLFAAGLS